MEIIVRNYKNDDLETVNLILQESFDITKTNFKGNNFYQLVATVNNDVVGYLLLTKVYNPIKQIYYFIIDYVCVLSTYRGLGIGKKLLEYVDKIARKENIVYIILTSSYKRLAAHKLYEKCGYLMKESNIFIKYINN